VRVSNINSATHDRRMLRKRNLHRSRQLERGRVVPITAFVPKLAPIPREPFSLLFFVGEVSHRQLKSRHYPRAWVANLQLISFLESGATCQFVRGHSSFRRQQCFCCDFLTPQQQPDHDSRPLSSVGTTTFTGSVHTLTMSLFACSCSFLWSVVGVQWSSNCCCRSL